MHVAHRADLASCPDQDVDLGWRPVDFGRADRPSPDAVSPAGFQTGDERVWATQQQCRTHVLLDGRGAGEEPDDAGKQPAPRPTWQAPLVHRALVEADPDELSGSRHAEWEGGAHRLEAG